MSLLPKPTPAAPAPSKSIVQITVFYAVVLTVFAVAQLYSFDEFIEYIGSSELALPSAIATLFVPVLIVAEVFALPFLLRMSVSPAFRWFSMGFALLAPVLLVFISSWIVFGRYDVPTVGFLGTAVDLIPGAWAVCMSAALVVLGVWSVWGLWPGKAKLVTGGVGDKEK